MQRNNEYLILLVVMFMLLALFAPMINEEFGTDNPVFNTDIFVNELGQTDPTSLNTFLFFWALFFWVFGAPAWINLLILLPLRILFLAIVYDKFRGNAS